MIDRENPFGHLNFERSNIHSSFVLIERQPVATEGAAQLESDGACRSEAARETQLDTAWPEREQYALLFGK